MITVGIFINGGLLVSRSATNTGLTCGETGKTIYYTDDKKIIRHHQKDGANELAKRLLDTIHEYDSGLDEKKILDILRGEK